MEWFVRAARGVERRYSEVLPQLLCKILRHVTLTSGLRDQRCVYGNVIGVCPDIVQFPLLHAELPCFFGCHDRVIAGHLRMIIILLYILKPHYRRLLVYL